MLKEKTRQFEVHLVSIESLVPTDNFYRQLESKLDLRFVYDLVKPFYKPFGRPSIDPVVFFKLQLIMFFEDIRSERQLMQQVHLNLAWRWYIGYDLNEKVPDHSSLSKIRDRFGVQVFQQFFEKIVELCIDTNLVWGKELYFDGTQVFGNAHIDSLVNRIQPYIIDRFPEEDSVEGSVTNDVIDVTPPPKQHSRRFIEKYNGERIPEQHKTSGYKRTTDERVSTTDPDATPMLPGFGGKSHLGYHTHYVVDGGKSRIILAALITPASVMDNTPMLDLARWTRFRWQIHPQIAVGDTRYGSGYNIAGLEQDGIKAYIPPHIQGSHQRHKKYHQSLFTYNAVEDHYICPQGEILPYKFTSAKLGGKIYRAKKKVCDACPVTKECRTGKYGRRIRRSFYQKYTERAEAYQSTEAYKKAMRKRQVWVEPKFGEIKQWHRGRCFRLRGLDKVNIEGLLRAAGQNIKQLLKANLYHRNAPLPPDNSVLPLSTSKFSVH